MKDIFSKKLYLQGLRKVRTLGVAMAIVMIALNAWIPLTSINEYTYLADETTILIEPVEMGMFAPFGLLLLIFAPLLVYNMFSYLNERRASDFFHALPQKRICVYISFMSAIMTWIASVLLVSTAVNTILWSAATYYELSADVVILNLLSFFIMALVLVGFMALTMMLTGTSVSNCLVFLLFFLFIRACGIFFLYGLESLTPMFNPMYSLLHIFEWEFFLPLGIIIKISDGGMDYGAFGNAGMFVYWFIVGVLLLVGSAVAYCLRKSETATKSAPNKIMQNIYRIGVTFPFLMLGAFLFITDKEVYGSLFCIVVAFLVWIIFELLTTKKIKNVVRSLPLLLVPVLMTAVFVASLYGTSNFVRKNTPERDEIVGARIDVSGGQRNLVNAVLSVTEAQSPEILDMVYQAIEETKAYELMDRSERSKNGYVYTDTVIVRLKSGRKVAYNLRTSIDLYSEFQLSAKIRENILLGLFGDVHSIEIQGLEMSQAEYEEIRNAMKEDFKALSDEKKNEYLFSAFSWRDGMACAVEGEYQGVKYEQRYYINSTYMPTAMNLILQYHEKNKAETMEDLQKIKDFILQLGENDFVSMEITGYIFDKSLDLYEYETAIIQAFLQALSVDEHLTDYKNAKNIYKVTFTMHFETKPMDDVFPLNSRALVLTLSEEDIQLYKDIHESFYNLEPIKN